MIGLCTVISIQLINIISVSAQESTPTPNQCPVGTPLPTALSIDYSERCSYCIPRTPTATGLSLSELDPEDWGIEELATSTATFLPGTPSPTPAPTNTPTPPAGSTAVPTAVPTYSLDTYWSYVLADDITHYQSPTSGKTEYTQLADRCGSGGYIVGVRYLFDQRSNGQNQGYTTNKTYNGETTIADRPASGDYGLSTGGIRMWLISSNMLAGVPTTIDGWNLSTAQRPNTSPTMTNPYIKTVFTNKAMNTSNPLGYMRYYNIRVFCRGGSLPVVPTAVPTPDGNIPPDCGVYEYQDDTPIVDYTGVTVTQGECRAIIPEFEISLPAFGTTAPEIGWSVTGISLCPKWVDLGTFSMAEVDIPSDILVLPAVILLMWLIFQL